MVQWYVAETPHGFVVYSHGTSVRLGVVADTGLGFPGPAHLCFRARADAEACAVLLSRVEVAPPPGWR